MHTFSIYAPETPNTECVRIHYYMTRQMTGFGCGWGQPFGWNQEWDQPFGWVVSQLFGRAQEYDGRREKLEKNCRK